MAGNKSYSDDICRNNLDKSSSPYLLQHIDNPVWWQEWSEELLKHAVNTGKPLLVSVGYSTCHWCHVMAAEAFSDIKTAEYLNGHFISVKIDREQRPDIDQFMMDFINSQDGRGGWPLNVFLTPDMRPVFAMTYAPAVPKDSMNSFLSVAEQVYQYLKENSNKIPSYSSSENRPSVAEESSIAETLSLYYDQENGGFGSGQKFPSHSTILYLLYQLSIDDSPSIRTICTKTLDAISSRGLNDHLQGGIFRYCVDKEWTIPHFEKMLYDQAMGLWSYSLAYRVIGKEEYKIMAEKILKSLDETFAINGLFLSAHDADTGHEEGSTYLWSYDELQSELLPEELTKFSEVYYITKSGNFEGSNHLIRLNNSSVREIEEKLLSIRKKRKQPSTDEKIISGINALVAVAMVNAARLLGRPDLEKRADSVVRNILDRFWDGKSLSHSLYKDNLQNQQFLSDAAALLTAITFLCESDSSWDDMMKVISDYVLSFREDDKWIESDAEDFQKVYASWFDHPFPSGVSLAEMGLARAAILTGEDISGIEYRQPFQSDFYNIAVMLKSGSFHIFTSAENLPWEKLPANSVQIRGKHEQDCYMGTCSPLDTGLLR
jgi:uncharacterized protein YyaL (SSP411 family)